MSVAGDEPGGYPADLVRAAARFLGHIASVLSDLRRALLDFRQAYNTTWLIERHGFNSPSTIRAEQLSSAALAA